MLVRRSRHLCTSHVKRCRSAALTRSLESRRWCGLRMLLRRVCLILMWRLLLLLLLWLICSFIRQD